jgi:hypothetical protein
MHRAGSEGTMRPFPIRSDNGEDEAAGSSGVVERRCENFEGSGESETLGTSGGEEAASDAWRCCAEGHEVGSAVSVDQSKKSVGPQLATGKSRNGLDSVSAESPEGESKSRL